VLIDTTVLIDALRGKAEAMQMLHGSSDLYTTEVNIFELVTGIYRENKTLSKSLAVTRILMDNVRVLPLERRGALKAAEISAFLSVHGKTLPASDCLIAGIAFENGITQIATSDKADFERIPGITVIAY